VFAGALVATAAISGSSFANEQILCTHRGRADAVITLQAMNRFNRVLDCISGDFCSDLTPCAPTDAYGLSAPTGAADLVKIVDRWQDYMGFLGGVTSHFITPDKIHFAGGFVGGRNGYYEEHWSFTVSRLTGIAQLKETGKEPTSYACRLKKTDVLTSPRKMQNRTYIGKI
jgi:hypothetical protein